ncbi:unnamed protein product [Ostreobium quekettii]|uniref:Uncharacterized protein n=1 Tax=Ostreobium quekettii TaxID=121088 RepID=A0A8S1J2C9_9CHLO|nr:unnamed protein product [Ostreobium quekettii]
MNINCQAHFGICHAAMRANIPDTDHHKQLGKVCTAVPSASDCRWQPAMKTPYLSFEHWRKSSQWKVLNRNLAELVVADQHVKEIFRRHCYSRNSPKQVCIPDEHYIPTLIASYNLENETDCIGRPTYYSMYGGSHPRQFNAQSVSVPLIRRMQAGDEDACDTRDIPEARRSALKLFTGLNGTGCARGAASAETLDAPLLNPTDVEGSDNWVLQSGYRPLGGHCPLFARKFLPGSMNATLAALLSCRGGALGSWC